MLIRHFNKLFVASEIALSFNVFVLGSVVLNLEWVRTHAAGGRFTDFPIEIRIGYLVQTLFMLFFMAMLWNHREKPLQGRGPRLARFIGYLFVASAALNVISPTTNERWNAIPASIIAVTFLTLARRDTSSM